jgi:hypothetical protein
MKKQLILLVLGLGLSTVASALAVKPIEQDYLDIYRDDIRRPVPRVVVSPVVSKEFSGHSVNLLVEVGRDGRVSRVTSRSPADASLMGRLVYAVSQWEFAPRIGKRGEARPSKVLLPVRIR